jgi:CubicO group peptidase (beta-lactamase class C family)
LLGEQLRLGTTAGATVGIARAGQLAFARGYGDADRERAIAASEATRYRVGSITSQFTAAGILRLAERKALAVDDTLARYVPEYRHAGAITLRQLLNQSSGISPKTTEAFTGVFAATTPGAVIARLNGFELDSPPGARFENAHVNYYLLGVVLERVAATPYGNFVQEEIAGPLGLPDTYLDGTRPASAVAAAYNADAAGLSPVEPWNVDYTFSSGGFVSTVADLLRWNAALRSNRFLSAASWGTMTAVPGSSSSSDYAMGLVVNRKGDAVRIWHNGRAGGAHAMNAQYRDVDYDVVVLANTNGSAGIVPEDLANMIVGYLAPQCAFADKPPTAPRASPRANRGHRHF